MCGDYRRQNDLNSSLNTRTAIADECFRAIGESCYFSKLDMKSGYLQIPMHPACKDMTSIWFDHDLYRYKFVPFGLKQAVQHFQRVMDVELRHCTGFTQIFLDDILVHSATYEDHL